MQCYAYINVHIPYVSFSSTTPLRWFRRGSKSFATRHERPGGFGHGQTVEVYFFSVGIRLFVLSMD